MYSVAQSVDGFIAAPDDDLGWLMSFGFEQFQAHHDDFVAGVGALVLGGATYRWLAASGEEWPYGATPAWVLTRSPLPVMPGAEGVTRATDAAEMVHAAREAAGARDVWVVGGGAVAARIAEAGLLDELRVTVMPVTLGAGTPLLPITSGPRSWALSGTTAFDNGAIELRYRSVP